MPGVQGPGLIEPQGFDGGKTIVDDYLREVRPLFFKLRTYQRTVYRPGEICTSGTASSLSHRATTGEAQVPRQT
jgi:hypothetical protein